MLSASIRPAKYYSTVYISIHVLLFIVLGVFLLCFYFLLLARYVPNVAQEEL